MPNVTLYVEESSPLLVFSDGWGVGSSTSDRFLSRYSKSGYMSTTATGSSVTFVYTGSEISIWGAKRPTYGQYEIKVNGEPYLPRNARSDPEEFQASIFSASWPVVQRRTVSLTSMGRNTGFDLDFVSWTFPVGNPDDQIVLNTYLSSHSSFRYTPDSAWSTNPTNVSRFLAGSGRSTSREESTVEFSFEGDAVSLFGPVGPTGTTFTASVDSDGLPDELTTEWPNFVPDTMLYHRANLGPGKHKLSLSAGPFDNGREQIFAVGYAQVYSSSSSPGGGSSGSLSPGMAAGITAGVLLAALLIMLGIGWLAISVLSRKRRQTFHFGFSPRAMDNTAEEQELIRPFLQMQSPPVMVTTYADPILRNTSSNRSLPQTPVFTRGSPSGPSALAAAGVYAPAISVAGPSQEIIVPNFADRFEKSRIPLLQPPPIVRASMQVSVQNAPFHTTHQQLRTHEEEVALSAVPSSNYVDPAIAPPPMYAYNDPSPSPSKIFPFR